MKPEAGERHSDDETHGPTRGELLMSIDQYELREARILDAFESHPVTEYALQRSLESDWRVDCFELRIGVLQSLIERHFDLEGELMLQIEASMQRRDLRLIGARMQSLRTALANGRAADRSEFETPESAPAAAE